jgi:phosphatidylethanolamine/phosphatidyl-N-methylethanolamine N-methyltransferase
MGKERRSAEIRAWDGRARFYDRLMVVIGGPIPAAATLAAQSLRKQHRIIELACGTGLFSGALVSGEHELTLTDASPAMIERTRKRMQGHANVTFRALEIGSGPEGCLDEAAWDGVLAANVLHLLPDLPAVLAEIHRALVPGGRLCAPTYCHNTHLGSRLVSRVLRAGGLRTARQFSLDELANVFRAAGFVIVQQTLVPGLLPIGVVTGERVR